MSRQNSLLGLEAVQYIVLTCQNERYTIEPTERSSRSVVQSLLFLTSSLYPSSRSSFSFSLSSVLSSSSSRIWNRRSQSLDSPSSFGPNVAVTWVGRRRYGAEVGVDCRKLSKRIFLPKGTYQSVVHSKGQVALIERRVGAAGEHWEVDHVREPPQHLLVYHAQVNCGES